MVHNPRITTRNIIVICILLLLFIAFAIFMLEKTQVVNFYKKPIKATTNPIDSRPVNNIEYTPSTSTEQSEGNQIKQNLIDQANATQKPSSNISISLSAANQDTVGGPLVIRSIIGSTSGTCKLSLTNGALTKTYTSEVINQGTYYSCKGFDIPVSDLDNGQWQLNLKIVNGQSSGEVNQKVEITK